MRVRLRVGIVGGVAAMLLTPLAAAGESIAAFKTPGEAAYCQMEVTRHTFTAFRCFTPNDGWWIRFNGLMGDNVQVTKGIDDRYRGFRSSSYSLLGFGKTWLSSDASVVTCTNRSTGLTCEHRGGLTFRIGRYRGYRIYLSPPGEKPAIERPFFRTVHGFCCGLAFSLEPDAPSVTCWRPTDGLELSVHHQRGVRAAWSQNENARGYRPRGYSPLGSSETFTWRCSNVDAAYATGCSRSSGQTVFVCASEPSRLTCRNNTNRGFWISRSSFCTF
jgi:hypothetical protein